MNNFTDFGKGRSYYVDKSLFIEEAMGDTMAGTNVFCYFRRTGKTTNFSMLKEFIEYPVISCSSLEDKIDMFKDTKIVGSKIVK